MPPHQASTFSGYSQGALVAHNAANMISASANVFVNSIVPFGDHDDGYPFGTVPASKVSTDYHVGDDICAHSNLVLPPYLTYCLNASREASFAFAQSGLA
jgi:cutinase